MLIELEDLSPDFRKLAEDGFKISVLHDHLVVDAIPHLDSEGVTSLGKFVIKLNMSGNSIVAPNTHVVHFIGSYPCKRDGTEISAIRHSTINADLMPGTFVNFSFSNVPNEAYDYYTLVKHYGHIISAHVDSPNENARENKTDSIEDVGSWTPFVYPDTNSVRAEIVAISHKLAKQRIGIIGTGGTGSYVLDFVAKTYVAEIHLIDGDIAEQHTAFRSPGAIPLSVIEQKPFKVDYLSAIYSEMHNGIVAHREFASEENSGLLKSLDFVFICIDDGAVKRTLFKILEDAKVPFVDVGMGLSNVDGSLLGILRSTLSTENLRDHIYEQKLVDFSASDEEDDVYSTNIQIAELNAFNASLAVFKWKQLFGFYHDVHKCHNTMFSMNDGALINDNNTA